jgi:multicomponent Na+:H+ antiporter subunit E
VLRWERRIVRAVGTPEQYEALTRDEEQARRASAAPKGGAR